MVIFNIYDYEYFFQHICIWALVRPLHTSTLTSVSSNTGLSLESIVLSVFKLGFTFPASIHNFFQSLSVKIDLLSEMKKIKIYKNIEYTIRD